MIRSWTSLIYIFCYSNAALVEIYGFTFNCRDKMPALLLTTYSNSFSWKCIIFAQYVVEVCSQFSNYQYPSIGSVMAWHRQAIIWTNYGLFTDAIYMSLNAMLGCHIQACCHIINLKRFGTNVISDYFITCTTEIFHSSVVVFIPPLIITTDTCEIYSPGWCTYWSVKRNRISWHPTSECASKSYKIILMMA